jgi:hypothetical protein
LTRVSRDNYNDHPMPKRKNHKAHPQAAKKSVPLAEDKAKIDASHISVKLEPKFGLEPRVYIPILYALVFLSILFLVFFLPGLSQARRNVAVLSEPKGAGVYLNGQFQGTTPFYGTIPAEKGNLTVSKPGFSPSVQEINDAGAQLFALGLGWFAQEYSFVLESSQGDAYLMNNLLDYSLWSRVGGFGQRSRMKKEYAPNNLSGTEVVVEEGGEYFLPHLLADSLHYSSTTPINDPSFNKSNLIREYARYTNDAYLYDQMAETLDFPKINYNTTGQTLEALESEPALGRSAYLVYWLLENSRIARFNLQHINYTSGEYSLASNLGGDTEYRLNNSDNVRYSLGEFFDDPILEERLEGYRDRLASFRPQAPRPLGRFVIGPLNFQHFSNSLVLLEDNYLGPFDALNYLQEPPRLAISVDEFALGTSLLSQNLWAQFVRENPDYRDKLPKPKYHPGPAMQRNPPLGIAAVSYQEAKLVAQWLNDQYSEQLGDWTIVIQGEDHFQASLEYLKNNATSGIQGFDADLYAWTSHYYAPGTLLLNPWGEALENPLNGFEKVIRGGADPFLRAALPENWRAANVAVRFALIKK